MKRTLAALTLAFTFATAAAPLFGQTTQISARSNSPNINNVNGNVTVVDGKPVPAPAGAATATPDPAPAPAAAADPQLSELFQLKVENINLRYQALQQQFDASPQVQQIRTQYAGVMQEIQKAYPGYQYDPGHNRLIKLASPAPANPTPAPAVAPAPAPPAASTKNAGNAAASAPAAKK